MQIYNRLKSELSLAESEIDKLKTSFNKNDKLSSPLLFGMTKDEIPGVVIGGPCIRYDLEKISLNSVYQVLIPIYVANQLNVPCLIFLGIQEEIILSPKKYSQYKRLGEEFKKIICLIAAKYRVEIRIIDTSLAKYNYMIEQVVKDLDIFLSRQESAKLFTISKAETNKIHSNIRCIVSARVVSCHTERLLKKLAGKKNFVIVEDMEQYPCYLFSKKFSRNKPNFLSFLPAPSPDGKSSLFKSKEKPDLEIRHDGRFVIDKKVSSVSWVTEIYETIEQLLNCEDK